MQYRFVSILAAGALVSVGTSAPIASILYTSRLASILTFFRHKHLVNSQTPLRTATLQL